MPNTATATRTSSSTVGHTPRFVLVSTIAIAVATAMNLGLYAIGRGADAALRLDPGAGAPNHLIIAVDVAWKTAVPLVLGALVLALVARISRRWTTITIVTGAALAASSIPFVFTGAHDTLTGILLASMHTVAILAYILIGTRARLNAKI